MSLFQWGNFKLHSGGESWWRIDCDDLTDSEIALFAKLIRERCGMFHEVTCPPSHPGSAAPRLVNALYEYKSDFSGKTPLSWLVVDDVLTSGASMEEARKQAWLRGNPYMKIWGAVLFARGEYDNTWITPVFCMPL